LWEEEKLLLLFKEVEEKQTQKNMD